MLKKEISEVLKQILFFILVITVLPGFLRITSIVADQTYFDIFFGGLQVWLLFWAMFMGISLFSSDRGQKGMEYLLSLPYSRLQIFVFKILPRLVSVVIFFLVFLILYWSGGEDKAAFSLLAFSIVYFSFFLIALSLSASSENFIFLSVFSLFSLIMYLWLIFLAYRVAWLFKDIPYYELDIRPFFAGTLDRNISGHILAAAFFLLLPLVISFYLTFTKLDGRPPKVFNKRHIKYLIPLFILGFITSSFSAYKGMNVGYGSYYLTQNHKLIESNPYSDVKIYDGGKVYRLKGINYFSWPFMEENEYVYDVWYEKIIRFNTSTHTVEVLYTIPPKKRWIGRDIWKYGQTIAFIEKNRDFTNIQLVLLDEHSKHVKRIPFDRKPLSDYPNPFHFGTGKQDDKRFWLVSSWGGWRAGKYPILILWEDGRIEDFGYSHGRPFYINQKLITTSEKEVFISREKEGRFEVIEKIPNSKGYRFRIGFYTFKNLNPFPLKELYGYKKGSKYARLDLETFEIEELSELKRWPMGFYPESGYYYERDQAASVLNIYRLKENKSELIKSFKMDFSKSESDYYFTPGGLIITQRSKVRVFAFPDLKELKFKRL
ncbi:MAG: hypothetical protein KAU46_09695 [Candidatus Aminicenantes bacterium]|nr:hypothetical protein [Candidatus Aminicenantes bacterium]